MLEEPISDVNVNAEDERGLLGIAVSKNSSTEMTYVFLFYTEAKGTEDGGEPIANRLYRYELVDDKLVNPKLGMQYENDMFVGSVKDRLLHFKLDESNRTELILNGTLSDKVADTVEDIEDVTFAEGLGIITDVKVGPDGYLYIVTGARSPEGKIYRILPATVE
jgi:hypothetical protein